MNLQDRETGETASGLKGGSLDQPELIGGAGQSPHHGMEMKDTGAGDSAEKEGA